MHLGAVALRLHPCAEELPTARTNLRIPPRGPMRGLDALLRYAAIIGVTIWMMLM
jgi:hypothetical protein